MRFNCILFFVTLAVVSGLPIFAATEPEKPPVSFRAVAWNREIPDAFYEVAGKRRALSLHRGAISAEQTYEGSPQLTLFEEVTAEDGQVKKEPLTSFRLNPPPVKNLVVVWVDKSGACQSVVLADDPSTLPLGNARFVNITRYRLAINSGASTYTVEPGASQLIAAPKGGLGIKIAVQMETNGVWKLAMMNSVRVRPNSRVTVFIADPSTLATAPEDADKEIVKQPLDLFVVTDRVPTAKAP